MTEMRRLLTPLIAIALLATGSRPAVAHDGPPYAIIVDRPTGPASLSVWADPDVGVGTFYVYLEPLDADTPVPDDARVTVSVRPKTGRLAEASFDAEASDEGRRDQVRYYCEVPFDHQEWWQVRFDLRGGGSEGSASTEVEVTPPGQGPVFDFILYLFPFVAVGVLVVRGLLVSRRSPDREPSGREPS